MKKIAIVLALIVMTFGFQADAFRGNWEPPVRNCPEGMAVTGFDGLSVECMCVSPIEVIPTDTGNFDSYYRIRQVKIVEASAFGPSRNFMRVSPGETFAIDVQVDHKVIPECPGCIIQFQFGYADFEPEPCLTLPRVFAPLSVSITQTMVAPMEPGVYEIDFRRTLELSCLSTWENTMSGVNWTRHHLATVCVE